MEQRTEIWFNSRKGRFTASRISELLGIKGLGLTGENYAFEKATELVFGLYEEESFTSYDMQRGINLEPFAFRKFKELKTFSFLEVKESFFFPYTDNAGASPDGLVGEDCILEIKCPRPNKFFKLVSNGIEAIDKIYIDQMQMQMLCTGRNKAYLFNYLIHEGTEYYHEIIVERDELIVEKIKERLKEAIEIKLEYINKINKNQQWK